MSTAFPLKLKAEVRAVTRRSATLARAVMSSSDIPSLKGSFAGSAPMLTNGSTAMERSEEHTSELQSRQYLVCRLLLEKKKKKNTDITSNCKLHISCTC